MGSLTLGPPWAPPGQLPHLPLEREPPSCRSGFSLLGSLLRPNDLPEENHFSLKALHALATQKLRRTSLRPTSSLPRGWCPTGGQVVPGWSGSLARGQRPTSSGRG